MRRLNYGDCFIEPEDQTREKIKRIYFVKDIDKETYTTICIHLDCKGQVTERTDYKKNIIRQMRKFDTPQKYFMLKHYMKWTEEIVRIVIPEISDEYKLVMSEPIELGNIQFSIPFVSPISGQIDLSEYFKENKR